MDRRDTLKTLLVGSIAGGTVGMTVSSCKSEEMTEEINQITNNLYGRFPDELARDAKLFDEEFLTENELETIAVLCDIILPATDTAGSATDAQVPAFIDFIVKDMTYHQLPIRGGLMWLKAESNKRFGEEFIKCSDTQQIQIIDDIAYPDQVKPGFEHGVKFFNKMRDLTMTGYYTTKIGYNDLGYVGNRPNVWDGVPPEVLKDHDVDYDPEWIAKCVDQEKRNDIAVWDENGNLIS